MTRFRSSEGKDPTDVRVLFCCDPLDPARPEPDFARETRAAEAAGIGADLVDHDAAARGDSEAAVRSVRRGAPAEIGAYRGWMLSVERYASLFDALAARGLSLVNDADAYRRGHHLPESYAALAGVTPRTAWLECGPEVPMSRVHGALAPFGDRPVVLKDFVKSEKHLWTEACFIPSAADRGAVERVVRRFLDLRGEDLQGGLVFREHVALASRGRDPRSGRPLAEEWRAFLLDGVPLLVAPHDDAAPDAGEPPPLAPFVEVARRLGSRFVAMDLARLEDGGWIVIEVGDGQVSGLPAQADPEAFFRSLRARLG